MGKTVSAFCEICDKFVKIIIKEDIKTDSSGLKMVEYTHGSPKHTLIVYIDKFNEVRGEAVIKTDNPKKAISELKKTHIRNFKNKLNKNLSKKLKEF